VRGIKLRKEGKVLTRAQLRGRVDIKKKKRVGKYNKPKEERLEEDYLAER